MDELHKETYKGFTIRVYPDEYMEESPRDWSNLGHMIAFHRNYQLGDEHSLTPEELMEDVKRDDVVALPLYLLDHSGLWLKTSRYACDPGGWDTSHVGYIYITQKEAMKEMGWKRWSNKREQQVVDILEEEVEIYNQWLTGEIYFYNIEDENGNPMDSCGGIYDDLETIIVDCKSMIDNYTTHGYGEGI